MLVCQGDLTGASEKQALGWATAMASAGHDILLSLHGDSDRSFAERPAADRLRISWRQYRGPRLARRHLDEAREFRPELVHAFNPRVAVLKPASQLARATCAPLLVHWEDDEWSIRRGPGGRSLYRRMGRLGRRAICRVYPPQGVFVSPRWLRRLASSSAGFDALTPTLAQHIERELGRECAVILPNMPDADWDAEPAPALDSGGAPVVLFAGEIHPGSCEDVMLGLRAIALVQRRGHAVVFAHAGKALARYDVLQMGRAAGVAEGTVKNLGYFPFRELPALLKAATILLQPGRPIDFNRLRLPSKMQAYLASGTPTITFAAGFAELLEDREEVLKTHGESPDELADRIVELLESDALRAALSRGGPRAAARLFDPALNAEALAAHYRRCLERVQNRPSNLYVIQAAEYSGAETAQLPVLEADPDPLLACPAGSRTEQLACSIGVPTVDLPFRTMRHSGGRRVLMQSVVNGLRSARDLRQIMLAHPHRKLVVGIALRPAMLAAVAGFGLRRRTVWIVPDFLPPVPLRVAIQVLALVTRASAVTPSETVARDFVAGLPPLRRRVRVINPGVDLDRFAQAREFDGRPPRIGVYGHVSPTKQTGFAIDVVELVAREVPEAGLDIVGHAQYRHEDLAYEQSLHDRVATDSRLRGLVSFRGYAEDVARAFQAVSLVLHCRTDEPFGMVLIEAMGAGLPVVAPASAGPLEIVERGRTGLLYPPGDAVAAAASVVTLLRDPERAQEMGRAGRETVRRRFSAERQVALTEQALREAGGRSWR